MTGVSLPTVDRTSLRCALRLVSEANSREHWGKKAKRAKTQRQAIWAEWLRLGKPTVPPPCVVTITRIAPRVMDCDNLQRAAKAVRDAVAEHVIGADDGDARIQWRYEQRAQKPKTYAVDVVIEGTIDA